jgi:hypothetical protein
MTKRTRYFVFGSVTVLLVGLCTGLVAYYAGLPMGAFARTDAPAEFQYVPPDAAVVAFVNVQDVMRSELRQKLHAAMKDHHEEGQAEFERETGINIEHDVDRVVAFLEPGTGDSYTGMLLATGRFDQGRLEALARQHGGQVEEYKGKRVVSKAVHHDDDDADDEDDDEDEGEHAGDAVRKPPVTRHAVPSSMTVAFLAPGLVAVGETAVVKRAIDRQGAESILANAELMGLVRDIDDSNAWAVGRFDALASRAKLPTEMASQIPAIKWFSASGHINGGVAGLIRAEARDDQAAQNLRDVVQGFLALARLQTGSKPELQSFVNSLQLSGSGKTVALSFTLPTQMIEAFEQLGKKAE